MAFKVALNGVGAERVSSALNEIWAAEEVQKEVDSLEKSGAIAAGCQMSVEDADGIDPATVAIAVAFFTGAATALGEEVAKSIWNDIVWPRLRDKFGPNVKDVTKDNED